MNWFSRCILFSCLGDKINYEKIAAKEDYKYFLEKEKIKDWRTLCKIQKFIESFDLFCRYFEGKEIIPNEDSTKTEKKASDRDNRIFFYNVNYCFKWKSKRTSLSNAAEEVSANTQCEKQISLEDKLICNQYKYNPTKLTKWQQKKLFLFMVLKSNQMRKTVILYRIQFVIFLIQKYLSLWFTEIYSKLELIKKRKKLFVRERIVLIKC